MNQPLVWDGQTPVRLGEDVGAPTATEIRVEITHTLCELNPLPVARTAVGTVVEAGARTPLTQGARVVLRCHQLASVLTVPATSCYAITDTGESLLQIPLVADILHSLDQVAPDLGWSCVVTGDDSMASLVTAIATNAGARGLACYAPEGAPAPPGATRTFSSFSGAAESGLSDVVENSSGPLVCFETTGSATVLQAVLNTIPPHASLILAGHGAGDVTSINFYQDVHKKNIRIIGAAGGIEARLGERAERFVRARLPVHESSPIQATLDTLPLASDGPFVLRWDR